MSCQKIKRKFHEVGKTNNCKRSCFQSDKCFHHINKPLFQLKPELMTKAAKKPSRIYNP
jgi:hypothetical protein